MTVRPIGDFEAAYRARRERPPTREQPTIRLGVDLHRVTDEACEALATSELYQRDGALVRVVRAAEPEPTKGIQAGAPTIRPVALATLREQLTRAAQWERYDARTESYRQCVPPDAVVSAVLERGEWSRVRALVGVADTPCLRPDGTILETEGHDAPTGIVLALAEEPEAVRLRPTQEQAMAALAELCDIFADFPFVDEPSRYVPIAGLLTMLARPAIRGAVPMIAIDASTRGSGKSLIADMIALITTGRSAARMTWPPNEEELEKILSACALFGSRLVALDNVNGTLGASPLDKVLTAEDKVALRILGKSEMRELVWRALIVSTGNNLVLGADTARRTLMSRLEPKEERPEERTGFRHPDLPNHVRRHRARLAAAALTILRGFVVAGRPNASSFVWGSFSQWAELVPAAIVWAGGANVLAARAVSMGAPDPEAEALRAVLAGVASLSEGRPMTVRAIVAALWPPLERGETRPPDGWDALRDGLEVLCPPKRSGDAPDPRRLGIALRRHLGRVIGGRRLTCSPNRDKTSEWKVVTS